MRTHQEFALLEGVLYKLKPKLMVICQSWHGFFTCNLSCSLQALPGPPFLNYSMPQVVFNIPNSGYSIMVTVLII